MDNEKARFALDVQPDGALHLTIGHGFTEVDIDALVAAENALHATIPAPRTPAG